MAARHIFPSLPWEKLPKYFQSNGNVRYINEHVVALNYTYHEAGLKEFVYFESPAKTVTEYTHSFRPAVMMKEFIFWQV